MFSLKSSVFICFVKSLPYHTSLSHGTIIVIISNPSLSGSLNSFRRDFRRSFTNFHFCLQNTDNPLASWRTPSPAIHLQNHFPFLSKLIVPALTKTTSLMPIPPVGVSILNQSNSISMDTLARCLFLSKVPTTPEGSKLPIEAVSFLLRIAFYFDSQYVFDFLLGISLPSENILLAHYYLIIIPIALQSLMFFSTMNEQTKTPLLVSIAVLQLTVPKPSFLPPSILASLAPFPLLLLTSFLLILSIPLLGFLVLISLPSNLPHTSHILPQKPSHLFTPFTLLPSKTTSLPEIKSDVPPKTQKRICSLPSFPKTSAPLLLLINGRPSSEFAQTILHESNLSTI